MLAKNSTFRMVFNNGFVFTSYIHMKDQGSYFSIEKRMIYLTCQPTKKQLNGLTDNKV